MLFEIISVFFPWLQILTNRFMLTHKGQRSSCGVEVYTSHHEPSSSSGTVP